MISLRETFRKLVRNGVDFVVVGGVAATLHGSATATFDLDICYSRTTDNLERLANALADLSPRLRGAPPGLPFLWDCETLRRGFNFTLTTGFGDIDILGDIAGVGSFDEVKAASQTIEAFVLRLAVLSLEALIRAKRAAGRDKDLRAIPELEALKEASD
ncbi:MAG: nucleotidyltransferase [Bryobacteraceae bacterium]